MRHNPNNALCDRNVYGPSALDVVCSCDVDSADDAPAPSTVIPVGLVETPAGVVTLTGSHAAAYGELKAATRELEAAKSMLAPAEARWRAALDRFHAEMLR